MMGLEHERACQAWLFTHERDFLTECIFEA